MKGNRIVLRFLNYNLFSLSLTSLDFVIRTRNLDKTTDRSGWWPVIIARPEWMERLLLRDYSYQFPAYKRNTFRFDVVTRIQFGFVALKYWNIGRRGTTPRHQVSGIRRRDWSRLIKVYRSCCYLRSLPTNFKMFSLYNVSSPVRRNSNPQCRVRFNYITSPCNFDRRKRFSNRCSLLQSPPPLLLLPNKNDSINESMEEAMEYREGKGEFFLSSQAELVKRRDRPFSIGACGNFILRFSRVSGTAISKAGHYG